MSEAGVNINGSAEIDDGDIIAEPGEFRIPTVQLAKFFAPVRPQATLGKLKPDCSALLKPLLEQHLLFLGGRIPDRAKLARWCAWKLRDELGGEHDAPEVREWIPGSGGPWSEIEGGGEPAILVLQRIRPVDLDFDLTRLVSAASARRHFVLISTDDPSESWGPEGEVAPFWHEPGPASLYHASVLAAALRDELAERAEDLPGKIAQHLGQDEEIALLQLAGRLKTPERALWFASDPELKSSLALPGGIEKRLEVAADDLGAVRSWFQSLKSDAKLLAIALSAFDGLREEDAFDCVERVYRDAFRARDPSIVLPDYSTFAALRNHLTTVEDASGVDRIAGRLPDLRSLVLRASWETHRRQILAMLPVLFELADELVASGSPRSLRRETLRAIAYALSELGRISRRAVNDTLLRFAAQPPHEMQAVAALAVAQWRGAGDHDRFFDLLEDWQSAHSLELIRSLVEPDPDRELESASLRSTSAIAIGLALEFDLPGELDPRLRSALLDLADDLSPPVRSSVARSALPAAIGLHLDSLESDIPRLATGGHYVGALASGLARAYRRLGPRVLEIVDRLRAEATDSDSQIDRDKVGPREGQAAASILALAEIARMHRVASGEGISPSDVLQRAKRILDDERHPFVRRSALLAVTRLARDDFAAIDLPFRALVEELSDNERELTVRFLKKIYVEQRRQLRGGDEVVRIGNFDYPVWLDRERPQTELEKSLARWVKESGPRGAKQVAYLAEIAFRTFERAEEARLEQLRRARAGEALAELTRDRDDRPQRAIVALSFYEQHVALLMATFGLPLETRDTVSDLLGVALRVDSVLREELLAKWDGEERAEIATRLRRAIFWATTGRLLVALAGMLLLAAIGLVLF